MQRKMFMIVLCVCLTVCVICLVGCKQSDSSKPRVALVMKSLANEFFKTMEDGAREHYQEHADK